MLDIESEFDELCDYIIRFMNAFKKLSSLQLGIYSYTGFFIKYRGDKKHNKRLSFMGSKL